MNLKSYGQPKAISNRNNLRNLLEKQTNQHREHVQEVPPDKETVHKDH